MRSMQRHGSVIQNIAYNVRICGGVQWEAGAKWLEGEDRHDCIMGVGGGRAPDASLAVTSATSSCDDCAMACADSVRNAPCAVHRNPAPQPPMTEQVMAAM